MTAQRPERGPLVGRFIRLDPYDPSDAPGLWRALGYPEVFAGGYGGGPAGLPADGNAFASWIHAYQPHEAGNSYTVRIIGGPDDGRVIGTSSLADFDERLEHAHIGWTAYDPGVWGTRVNPEAKLLLLGLAFGHGFGRVKLQADALNARSRAAIARIGATFEGIVRRDRLRADGTWRDSAVFSVLVDEWPGVRAGLLARLDEDTEPVVVRPRTDGTSER